MQFSLPKRALVLRDLSGALKNGPASADLNLPEVVRQGVYHEFDSQWANQTGVDWTHWSRFDEPVLRFANPKQPDLVEQERWHDVFRPGIAVLYRPFDHWRFRAGFAYDPTPVPNATRRTPRIPDHDRHWAALGLAYEVTDAIRMDLG